MGIRDRSLTAGTATASQDSNLEHTHRLVRAVCERCLSSRRDAEKKEDEQSPCAVCGGRRYYLWDPETHNCYDANGEPLRVLLESGRLVDIYRTPKKKDSTAVVTSLLDTLGRWAEEDSRRRFKLWFENEWICKAWPNQNRSKVYTSHHQDLQNCLTECLRKIEKNCAEECEEAV